MLLGYGYMRNSLVRLGDIPLAEMLLGYDKSLLFLLCVYMIKGDDALTARSHLSKRNEMNKNRLNTLATLSRRKSREYLCTNLN